MRKLVGGAIIAMGYIAVVAFVTAGLMSVFFVMTFIATGDMIYAQWVALHPAVRGGIFTTTSLVASGWLYLWLNLR